MAPAHIPSASEAYYKIFFHTAKHPHTPVNGVLLGSLDNSREELAISDAVPLLHHWTSLSPMMEIGLDLVRCFLYCLSAAVADGSVDSEGYTICGLVGFEGRWVLPSVGARG